MAKRKTPEEILGEEQYERRIKVAQRILESPYAVGIIVAAVQAAELLACHEGTTTRVSKERIMLARSQLQHHLYQRPNADSPLPETLEAYRRELADRLSERFVPMGPHLRLVED